MICVLSQRPSPGSAPGAEYLKETDRCRYVCNDGRHGKLENIRIDRKGKDI